MSINCITVKRLKLVILDYIRAYVYHILESKPDEELKDNFQQQCDDVTTFGKCIIKLKMAIDQHETQSKNLQTGKTKVPGLTELFKCSVHDQDIKKVNICKGRR